MKTENDSLGQGRLTQGNIARLLIRLTAQMSFGMFAVISFSIVDTIFVGRLGTVPLAAMSFTFPIIMLIGSITLGLGSGASAAISRVIGTGDVARVQRLTMDALLLNTLISVLVGLIGYFSIDFVFSLLGASDQEMPLIRDYMEIWYWGIFFHIIAMSGNSIIRATGDMKSPAIIMTLAVFLNLVLDPLLIFGIGPFPRMELAGAALATVVARALATAALFYVLFVRYKLLSFHFVSFHKIWKSWKLVLYVGAPTALTNIINPVSAAIITRLIATYSTAAVAAFGVATRVEALALAIFMALSAVVGPFVGQNIGAQKIDRVRTAIRLSQRFVLIYGVLLYLLLLFFNEDIVRLFNNDQDVVQIAVLYLTIVPLSYGLVGLLFLSTTSLNVFHKPLHSAILNLIHAFFLYVPLAYTGSYFFGLTGIFGAAFIAKSAAGLLGFWVFAKVLKKSW